MSEIGRERPECPECGASWVRSGPHFAVIGPLSDMRIAEATDEYYRNPEQYDDRPVDKFACGHYEVSGDE